LRKLVVLAQSSIDAASFSLYVIPDAASWATDRTLGTSHPAHRESDVGITLDRLSVDDWHQRQKLQTYRKGTYNRQNLGTPHLPIIVQTAQMFYLSGY
jgi:hypothetical protein